MFEKIRMKKAIHNAELHLDRGMATDKRITNKEKGVIKAPHNGFFCTERVTQQCSYRQF
jgi:hypothetical protein